MKKGAVASHKDSTGASVLVHAAHARMPKVVKALLAGAEGMDKDAASDEGVTALIAASMKVCACVSISRSVAYLYLYTGVHIGELLITPL